MLSIRSPDPIGAGRCEAGRAGVRRSGRPRYAVRDSSSIPTTSSPDTVSQDRRSSANPSGTQDPLWPAPCGITNSEHVREPDRDTVGPDHSHGRGCLQPAGRVQTVDGDQGGANAHDAIPARTRLSWLSPPAASTA